MIIEISISYNEDISKTLDLFTSNDEMEFNVSLYVDDQVASTSKTYIDNGYKVSYLYVNAFNTTSKFSISFTLNQIRNIK